MASTRKICIVVNSRANYGRIKSVLEAIRARDDLELQLIVGASALLYRFGNVLTRNAQLVALGQVVVHAGVTIGRRCGTHCHQFLHDLIHLPHLLDNVPDLIGALVLRLH